MERQEPSREESLDARVEVLERRARRSRQVSFAALGLAALGLGVAAGRPVCPAPGGDWVVSRLSLRDAGGVTRMTLSAREGGEGGLVLHDAQGQPRALLGVDSGGSPRLRFATAEGVMLAELTVYANEAPRLALAQRAGAEFFAVSLQADGSSRLEFADDTGRPRALLEVSPRGEPSLVLEGTQGAVFRAPVPVQ